MPKNTAGGKKKPLKNKKKSNVSYTSLKVITRAHVEIQQSLAMKYGCRCVREREREREEIRETPKMISRLNDNKSISLCSNNLVPWE